jgi:HK97 gp10 family phage protein
MSQNLRVTTKGAKELIRSLNELAPALKRSSEKAVLSAGARPIVARSKALAPVGKTGSLKKSIAQNVRMGKDGIRTVRIGPRADFKGPSLGMKVIKKGKRKGQTYESFVRPQNYSHLVEYGTSRTAARSFIRAGAAAAESETLSAMANGLSKHLDKVAARLRRKAMA